MRPAAPIASAPARNGLIALPGSWLETLRIMWQTLVSAAGRLLEDFHRVWQPERRH
jgi:hypothetical protein